MFAFLIDPAGWIDIGGTDFAPGFFCWNSEVGRRSVGIQSFWFERICQNHIVWDAIEVVELKRCHRGNVQEALLDVREAIREEMAAAEAGFRTNEMAKLIAGDSPDSKEFPVQPNTLDPRKAVLELDQAIRLPLRRALGKRGSERVPSYACERKIDGLHIVLTYEDGTLRSAVTRGDGVVGEDVTHNVRTIKHLPEVLSRPVSLIAEGEVYMSRAARR